VGLFPPHGKRWEWRAPPSPPCVPSGRYDAAFQATGDRDALLDAAAEAIERDLEFVGATAIEDKLQEGVPPTAPLPPDTAALDVRKTSPAQSPPRAQKFEPSVQQVGTRHPPPSWLPRGSRVSQPGGVQVPA